MAQLKGMQPFYILIGLMVCILVLVITFKLLGQFQAFEYEQQAEITTKNMQTAMNQVCVTGETQTVSVNFPQKLSSGGLAKDPLSLTKSIFTGNTAEVADSLRYMAALDSYGDPWYVIYFEDFPKGEDSGWQGWSTVSAQRGASFYFTSVGIASCMVPMAGELKSMGSRLVKGSLNVVQYAGEYKRSKYVHDIFNMLRITQASRTLRIQMLKDLARDIITSAKGGYKGSIEKVIQRFEVVSDGPSLSYMTKHLTAVKKIDGESLPEADTYLRSLKEEFAKTNPVARDETDSILKQIGDLRTNTKYTEGEYKIAVGNLVKDPGIEKIYEASSNLIDKDLPSIKVILQNRNPSTDYDFEVKYLDKLVERVKAGDITEKDVRLVRHITADPITHQTMSGAEDFVKTLENTQALQSNVNEIKSLSNNLFDDTFTATHPITVGGKRLEAQPIDYTRQYLQAADSGTSVIPKLSAYASMVGAERMAKGVAQNAVMREGRWVATAGGYSFIFNGAVISPLQQAQLKFSPCSGDSLCMKSAVNPSINVYPLEDCKAVGVNYIELDKTPADASFIGGSASAATVSTLNSLGSFMTGDKVTSKFYTASPCSGKMQIEKTKCDCKVTAVPYVDTSSIDSFIIKCKTGEWKDDGTNTGGTADITCELSKNMTYIGDSGEIVPLAKDITITAKYEDNPDTYTYDLSFDMADPAKYNIAFPNGENVWDEKYFGNYYKELSDASQNPSKDMQKVVDNLGTGETAEFSLPCEFSFVSKTANQEFECDQISLPAIPFTYHTCDTTGGEWLKCGKWVQIGDKASLVKDGVNKQEKIPANVWCCLQWGISKYEAPAGTGAELLSVPSCDLYPAKEKKPYDKYPDVKVTEEVIKNNLNCLYGFGCIRISPDGGHSDELKVGDPDKTFSLEKLVEGSPTKLNSDIEWVAEPPEVCTITDNGGTATIKAVSAGGCVVKAIYREEGGKKVFETIYTQKISASQTGGGGEVQTIKDESETKTSSELSKLISVNKQGYLQKTEPKIWATISNSYSITLPKEVLSSDGAKTIKVDKDVVNGDVGKIYWYNLPPTEGEEGDCLKVSYVKDEGETDETRGFCYTSPTAWADVNSIGWIVLASAVDVGSQIVIGAATGGAGTLSMVGSTASCLASNYIMWYGEQAVSKEKQKSYWPNSVYFNSYFT